MKAIHWRELKAHAKLHDLQLIRTANVEDAFDLVIARMAICQASEALKHTAGRQATTFEMLSGIAITVRRRKS